MHLNRHTNGETLCPCTCWKGRAKNSTGCSPVRSVVSVLGLDAWIEDNNPVLRLSLGCEAAYSAGREGIGMFSL